MFEQGKRLKQARELTHINRTLFSARHKISINSMNAWETGQTRFSEDKAHLLCQALAADGVVTSVDWLMTGVGDEPHTQNLAKKDDKACMTEDNIINREIALIKQYYAPCFIYTVHDDSCLPLYQPHDVVGGMLLAEPTLDKLRGQICIVELMNNAKVIRRIDDYKDGNVWCLSIVNPQSQLSNQQVVELKLKSIAPIIWFRRPVQR